MAERQEQLKPRGELIALADGSLTNSSGSGPVLSRETEDLDLNVVRLPAGRAIDEHVNREVDVVMVVLAGEGLVTVEDEEFPLGPQMLLVIPKGSRRAIRSSGEDALLYLSLHRRRARLWPTVKRSASSKK